MNRVERKHDRKPAAKGRIGRMAAVGACAALLCASLAAAGWMKEKAQEPAPPERPETGGILAETEEKSIRRVTVALRGQEPWTMVRNDGGNWQVEGETDWTVDPSIADRITDALACLEYTECYTDDAGIYEAHLADFGLEEPRVAVAWETEAGSRFSVRIGDPVMPEEADRYYLLAEGKTGLYGVDAGTVQDLAAEKTLLRDVPELSVRKALLDRITITDGDGKIKAEWRLQGQVTDQDAGTSWIISAPFRYPADEETIRKMKDSAGDLMLGIWVGDADAERLEACGLTKPEAVLEMHMAGGSTGTVTDSGVYDVTDWEEETVSIEIGRARDEMTVYVRIGNEIYTMTRFMLEALTEAAPLDTAARYAVLTPLNSLIRLETEKDGETHVYERAEETGKDGEPVTRWTKDGETLPEEAFEAAYSRLLTVTVSGRLPEGTEEKEPHTKYTFRTVSGGTHTVVLSDFDGIHDAVTLDGDTLFYLIHGGMTEMP